MSKPDQSENIHWLSEPPNPGQLRLYFEVASETALTLEEAKDSLRRLLEQMDNKFTDEPLRISQIVVCPNPPPIGPGPRPQSCYLRRFGEVKLIEQIEVPEETECLDTEE
jgi:hypothetical protein